MTTFFSGKHYSRWVAALLKPLLGGCMGGSMFQGRDSAPNVRVNIDSIPNATPRVEPLSKSGNPDTYVIRGKRYTTLKTNKGFVERGVSSWYGTKFHGRRTSSGETYNMYGMTAAHKTLPLPTYVEVTNTDNGRNIIVKVNDRGPFHNDRIIDLSYAAALKLDITKNGTGNVEIRAIDPRAPLAHRQPKSAPKATPKPTVTPTQTAAQQMYLQVGAFSSRSNAENLRNRVVSVSSSPVNISASNEQTAPVYRVRIGPLNNNQEMLQIASRLGEMGITNASIVTD